MSGRHFTTLRGCLSIIVNSPGCRFRKRKVTPSSAMNCANQNSRRPTSFWSPRSAMHFVSCGGSAGRCGARPEVRLALAKPKYPAPCEVYFRAPVRFERPMDALVFPRRRLAHRVVPSSPRAEVQLPSQ